MAQNAPLNLGTRAALQPGEYCLEDDAVLYRCKRCGTVDTLNARDIAPDGKVLPAWACSDVTCPSSTYLVLESWGIA